MGRGGRSRRQRNWVRYVPNIRSLRRWRSPLIQVRQRSSPRNISSNVAQLDTASRESPRLDQDNNHISPSIASSSPPNSHSTSLDSNDPVSPRMDTSLFVTSPTLLLSDTPTTSDPPPTLSNQSELWNMLMLLGTRRMNIEHFESIRLSC